jgi:hypothetical protein
VPNVLSRGPVASALGVGLVVTVMSLTACTSSAHDPPAKLVTVSGEYAEVGGPADVDFVPGAGCDVPRCVPDQLIDVYAGQSDSGRHVAEIRTNANGVFSVRVRPGTYFLEGHRTNPKQEQCVSGSIAVKSDAIHINILCGGDVR